MSLTIELDAPSLEVLNRLANDEGMRLEEFAVKVLKAQRSRQAQIASDAEFQRIKTAILEENDELLRRLAK